MKLTRTSVASLAAPPNQPDVVFWDDALPGFGVRVRASGSRRYLVQYRDQHGRSKRAVLGDVGTVHLDEARSKAREILARVRLGHDPQAEKVAARRAKSVGDLVDAYLEAAAQRMKARSLAETTRHLKAHAKRLHGIAAASVGRADIADLLAAIEKGSGPVAANRVRSSLSAMWTWAIMEGHLTVNPVVATRKRDEAPRERVLTDGELALIWRCTGSGSDHDRIVRLLLLTGLRREEVGRLMWAELAGSMLVIPGSRTKNGIAHEVPLPSLALAQLPPRPQPNAEAEPRTAVFGERPYAGYSGWSQSKARLDRRMHKDLVEAFAAAHGRPPRDTEARLVPWTLHDLRRTLSTWLSEHGEEPHVVEALLNHVSGSAKGGVAGVYNRASYREQKRAALVRWADHVASLTEQTIVNVVALGRG